MSALRMFSPQRDTLATWWSGLARSNMRGSLAIRIIQVQLPPEVKLCCATLSLPQSSQR